MKISITVCALALAATAGVVRADDTPQFKAGLWQFDRSTQDTHSGSAPLKASVQKCTDPTQLFNKKPSDKSSCEFSAMTRSGNTYSFTASCTIQGTPLTSKTVVVADTDSAYTMTVESEGGGQKTHEVLLAKRIGDCAH